MKILIVTNTGAGDETNGRNQGIRDTWLKWGGFDHRFVYGARTPDKMIGKGALRIGFDTEDSYSSDAFRLCGACVYAVSKGYDYVFKTDVDTYVAVPRLLQCDFVLHDYSGAVCHGNYYCGGGCGFWLSNKAARVLAEAKPEFGYGDLWTGQVLAKAGINAHHDPRYVAVDQHGPPFKWDTPEVWNGTITTHLGRGTGSYNPDWMRDCHKGYLKWAQ